MNEFSKYKKNITSQWGEDGIISEIFKRIGIQEKFCIEFGAWDGKHLSNVWNLWHEMGWSALLIEGDQKKCDDLILSTSSFKNVKPYCAYVEAQGKNSLDNILEQTFPKKKIDLLSIDIDGNDYYILESLQARPKVIIIEYNPTIPVDMELVQKQGEYFGSSALSIYNLAHKKGYKLITITETNFFLVHESEFTKLNIVEPNLKDIFIPDYLTYIMTAYDGTPAITKIPTYHNIKKGTIRKLHFKDSEFETISLSIYNPKNLYFTFISNIFNKIYSRINKKDKNKDLQTERVVPWFKIDGDKTLRLNYRLNSSSVVVDVGGYEGQWASDIFAKYCCNIIIFEPVKTFADKIKSRFTKNEKIKTYKYGLSNKNAKQVISLLADSSSMFKSDTDQEEIEVVDGSIFLTKENIANIDLMKINIEGGEYDLLDNLIDSGFIPKIKNIQVQFHDFVPNAKSRMLKIQNELRKTHHLTYQYEFVWENWEINEK